jgi:hypothetical protein
MYKSVTASLVNGSRVTELLIQRYGPELIWQVEQLSEHIFRGWLRDGRVALAILSGDGTLDITEIEDAG